MASAFRVFDTVVKERLALLDETENEASALARVVEPILTRGLGISEQDVRLEEPVPGGSRHGGAGRADLVIRMASNVVLLVECKAPRVQLYRSRAQREAIEQAERYANVLEVDLIVVTNGYQWILRSGRRTQLEARNREEFTKLGHYFFEWLEPWRLWNQATGLILPDDFEFGRKLVDRCRTAKVDQGDLSRLIKMRALLPERLYHRIEEEVHKSLAVIEISRLARSLKMPAKLSVIHLDPTFASYRQGAWLYDPVYKWHRRNEADILKSCARPQFGESAIRVFIVGTHALKDWVARLPRVGTQMLRDGWTTAIIHEEDLGAYEVAEGDVIGEYVIAGYSPGEAFDYHFERNPVAAARVRGKVQDYLATKPQCVFEPGSHAAQRLLEYCSWASTSGAPGSVETGA